ncbi:16S rRNA methyltransferase [Bifidobacterium actinocoloniiforme DSM 22766]|nr:16S rRNA methyltransferase [Bifidobacterium actinocoloniiforme DSM 22766]
MDGSPLLSELLGPALGPLERFHAKLFEQGLERGIIGPRDAGIIWERHILNSAAAVPFVRDACRAAGSMRVADLGSGGGFPGLVLAACMPECEFTLIEPMERRVVWLTEAVEEMGLGNASILRARAEELVAPRASSGSERKRHRARNERKGAPRTGSMQPTHSAVPAPFAVVTCRAVAPMTKLAGWALPLVAPGGRLVALKGKSAQAEIDKASKELRKYGGRDARVVEAAVGPGLESTHVVLVDKV